MSANARKRAYSFLQNNTEEVQNENMGRRVRDTGLRESTEGMWNLSPRYAHLFRCLSFLWVFEFFVSPFSLYFIPSPTISLVQERSSHLFHPTASPSPRTRLLNPRRVKGRLSELPKQSERASLAFAFILTCACIVVDVSLGLTITSAAPSSNESALLACPRLPHLCKHRRKRTHRPKTMK